MTTTAIHTYTCTRLHINSHLHLCCNPGKWWVLIEGDFGFLGGRVKSQVAAICWHVYPTSDLVAHLFSSEGCWEIAWPNHRSAPPWRPTTNGSLLWSYLMVALPWGVVKPVLTCDQLSSYLSGCSSRRCEGDVEGVRGHIGSRLAWHPALDHPSSGR